MHKLILIVSAFWSLTTFAQAPVVEAGTNSRGQTAAVAPAAATGGGNELIVTLYNQLEALQQEVQTLRGRVEEQDFQIKRMQTEQRDRYLDIDRRLSSGDQPPAVTGNAGLPPASTPPGSVGPAPTSPQAPYTRDAAPQQATAPNTGVAANTIPQQGARDTSPANTTASNIPSAVPQMDEQELYRTALNLLLEENNYEQSIEYFQTYITTYPQGRYLTNSYYWQGEAFILVGRFNEARDVFSKIITEFPQDPKAAGAMLKLGVAYREMGDTDQARRTWQEIATRYPESTTEIREAANYLRGQ
jgi:tol-pal system protein YbgF